MIRLVVIAILFFSLTAQAQLDSMATVVDGNGEKNMTSIDWDFHQAPVEDKNYTVRQFAGRVPLTRLNAANYDVGIEGDHCAYEGNEFVAYITDPETYCKYILGEEVLTYKISAVVNAFDPKMDPNCKAMHISVNPKIKNPPDGFFSIACESLDNGFRMTINYSDNFSLSGSHLHESYGKYSNFRTWEFIGLGQLHAKKDLQLNKFYLTDKRSKKKQQIVIRRKAFKYVRQSPFEVNIGLGLANVEFKSANQGDTGTTSMRAALDLSYLFLSKWLLQLDATADIIGFEGSDNSEKAAYFYYQSDLNFGYRYQYNPRNLIEVLPGMTFAKYSFQFNQDRRLYTRQGAHLKLVYKQVDREQTDFFAQINYVSFFDASDNDSFELKSGARLFSSKFTLWASYGLQNLKVSDDSRGPDKGTMITVGTSLDF